MAAAPMTATSFSTPARTGAISPRRLGWNPARAGTGESRPQGSLNRVQATQIDQDVRKTVGWPISQVRL